MKIPDSYPRKLQNILYEHVSHNIAPCWYEINYLNIKSDFDKFLMSLKQEKIIVCDIFGRYITYAGNKNIKSVSIYDIRKDYYSVAKLLYKDKINYFDIKDFNIDYYDLILINMEFGGVANHGIPNNLNDKFRYGVKIFGYEYNYNKDKDILFYRDNSGINNMIDRFKFKKLITSHMHEGYKVNKNEFVNFFDLTLNYKQ
ncbi:MAG: hypothetical protein RLN62_04940 [Rickettsiales bacterium]